MVALTSNEWIQPAELPFSFLNTSKINGLRDSILRGNVSLLEAEEAFEKELISDALKKANYVQSHAAELLGISRRILKYKIDKLGIEQENSKPVLEH
jgi:DNA-binding NtrC family response regulator